MLGLDWTAIVVAMISCIGVIVSAVYGYLKIREQNHRVQQAEAEMKFQKKALGFASFVEEWAAIEQEAQDIMKNTCIDRFLILRAWNGMLDPRWTTAIYQMRMEGQSPVSYVHFELDIDYQARLREISGRRTSMRFKVNEIPPSRVKDVYDIEGIKSAAWFHLHTEKIPDSSTVGITYCSFATHEDVEIDDATMTRLGILVSRLKGAVLSFDME
jgi:hypothetical protein